MRVAAASESGCMGLGLKLDNNSGAVDKEKSPGDLARTGVAGRAMGADEGASSCEGPGAGTGAPMRGMRVAGLVGAGEGGCLRAAGGGGDLQDVRPLDPGLMQE